MLMIKNNYLSYREERKIVNDGRVTVFETDWTKTRIYYKNKRTPIYPFYTLTIEIVESLTFTHCLIISQFSTVR